MSIDNDGQGAAPAAPPEPKKLVLCFDGTGNTFSGSNADTNVVKLLAKLDRNHPDQFHYYQTGIGTYDIKDESVNKSWWGEFKSNVSMTLDQGFGTTFDAHVLAGYRFLMRYYEPGCKVYMFGFSRGAFTAKFLARMVNTVGLLCKGNEEMVPFAFKLYQRYLEGDIQDRQDAAEEEQQRQGLGQHHHLMFHRSQEESNEDAAATNGVVDGVNGSAGEAAPRTSDESAPLLLQSGAAAVAGAVGGAVGAVGGAVGAVGGAAVGAVGAVGGAVEGAIADPSAAVHRAVAAGAAVGAAAFAIVDENTRPGLRGQFKHSKKTVRAFDEITAFSQTFCRNETVMDDRGRPVHKNIKVYFLGIWDCVNSVAVLEQKAPIPVEVTGTARYVRHAVAVDERRVKFKPALLAQDTKSTSKRAGVEDIKEVWFPGCHGDVGGGWPCATNNPMDNKDQKTTVWQRIKGFFRSRKPEGPSRDIEAEPLQMSDSALYWMIHELEIVGKIDPASAVKWTPSKDKFKKLYRKKKKYALEGIYHDSLAFSYGTGFFRVVLWWFMEYLPLITRWELVKDQWVNVRLPLNGGASRDIPRNAVLHESLIYRLQNVAGYRPSNNHGDFLPPCLHVKGDLSMELFKKNPKQEDEVKILEEPDPDNNEWVFASA